jgi:hypothetical protein
VKTPHAFRYFSSVCSHPCKPMREVVIAFISNVHVSRSRRTPSENMTWCFHWSVLFLIIRQNSLFSERSHKLVPVSGGVFNVCPRSRPTASTSGHIRLHSKALLYHRFLRLSRTLSCIYILKWVLRLVREKEYLRSCELLIRSFIGRSFAHYPSFTHSRPPVCERAPGSLL